jgi:hypothetical protein
MVLSGVPAIASRDQNSSSLQRRLNRLNSPINHNPNPLPPSLKMLQILITTLHRTLYSLPFIFQKTPMVSSKKLIQLHPYSPTQDWWCSDK